MIKPILITFTILFSLSFVSTAFQNKDFLLGQPGLYLSYQSITKSLSESVVAGFDLWPGEVEKRNETLYQLLFIDAEIVVQH
ncbi:hypothetical protein OU798_22695 [Prolixibacteraceae bacterium Z1-6]|uniref:Uncharacterized protein n=1 Tax=Draconibacterium aestuarii TaxID=2998507 RepID=A0A9X3FA09_9BACT|nr:hypothetical protein [Prolixibacteraceae bacterium Z1-6]